MISILTKDVDTISDEELAGRLSVAMLEFDSATGHLDALRTSLTALQSEIQQLRRDYDTKCRTAILDDAAALEATGVKEKIGLLESRLHGSLLELSSAEKTLDVARRAADPLAIESANRRRKREQIAKWRVVYAQCRDAKQAYEAANSEFRSAENADRELFAKIQLQHSAIARHEPISAGRYPTPAELRAEELALSTAKDALAELLKRRLALNLDTVRFDVLQAKQRLEHVMWVELQLRPANWRALIQGDVQGAAVR